MWGCFIGYMIEELFYNEPKNIDEKPKSFKINYLYEDLIKKNKALNKIIDESEKKNLSTEDILKILDNFNIYKW